MLWRTLDIYSILNQLIYIYHFFQIYTILYTPNLYELIIPINKRLKNI